MNLPNIIICGVPKSGTTSLAESLSMVNSVHLPDQKELFFFVKDQMERQVSKSTTGKVVSSINKYKGLFNSNSKYNIDASTLYFYFHQDFIRNLKEYYNPENYPKLVVVLRHPVDRFISHYKFNISKGVEGRNIREVIEGRHDVKQSENHLDYYQHSLYFDRIRFFQNEGLELDYYTFEEIRNLKVIQILEDYSDEDEHINLLHSNKTNISKYLILRRLLGDFPKFKNILIKYLPTTINLYLKNVRNQLIDLSKTDIIIDESAKKDLADIFRDEIEQLKQLDSEKFGHW